MKGASKEAKKVTQQAREARLKELVIANRWMQIAWNGGASAGTRQRQNRRLWRRCPWTRP